MGDSKMLRTGFALLLGLVIADATHAQLLFNPPSVDLGSVKSGQVFERAIQVKNAGAKAATVT